VVYHLPSSNQKICTAAQLYSFTHKGRTQTVFENRVLMSILGPNREEVTGGGRKLHSQELHNLYSAPNINNDQIKKYEMGGAYSSLRMVYMRNAYEILV
jgi:hypothetical protein